MRRMNRLLLFAMVVALVLVLLPSAALATKTLAPNQVGARAYSYVEQLTVAPRVAGTEGETAAAAKIRDWFTDAGYSPTMQPFTYVDDGGDIRSSQNVVAFRAATKKPKAGITPLVIIGAHYDNVDVDGNEGADDNASGVGVMLEVAERIAKYHQEFDIAFVAFGAEEASPDYLNGSTHYVNQMSEEDISRTIVMINFDSLLVGDKLYIHAGFNEKTWARDQMLRLVRLHKLPIGIQPGWNLLYPAGLTPDGFSDYTAFNDADIPIVAFESTNWEIGDYDGWIQTEKYGEFWHTSNDNLATIEELLPGRPMVRLNAYATLVFEFLKHLNP
jgi:alkaline phosphatase isozyme conversion protein